jgi:hypothetical protein
MHDGETAGDGSVGVGEGDVERHGYDVARSFVGRKRGRVT